MTSTGPSSVVPLRAAEGLDIVVISDNEILVQFGSRSHPSRLIRDTDLSGALGRVFDRLQQGAASRDELLQLATAGSHSSVAELLESLTAQGILVPADSDPIEQYLGYTFTGETRLGGFRVGQIGAGPLGMQIAESLLQHGIGKLTLLDSREPDSTWSTMVRSPVQPSSANQAQDGLRDRLVALGYANVEAYESGNGDALAALASKSDVVLLVLERPDVRLAHLLNRHCQATGTPWIAACLDGNLGVAGPLFVPGVTACYNDYRALTDTAAPSPMMARVYRRHADQRGAASFFAGLPAYASIIGGFASVAAIHHLLTGTSFLLGRTLTVNFDRMMIDVEDVLRLPRCPVCRQQRSAYQPPFSAEAVTRGRAATS